MPVYSQSNEDDIIKDIFSQIGEGKKRFFEFGCGDGRQNNTIALLLRGWNGIWVEPHRKRVVSARERWKNYPVKIYRRFMTPRNINKFIVRPYDFLSIDIDGDDYNVWYALSIRPRVVCIEYADPRGVPLGPIKKLGEDKGYKFYGTSESEVNAFFVRGD